MYTDAHEAVAGPDSSHRFPDQMIVRRLARIACIYRDLTARYRALTVRSAQKNMLDAERIQRVHIAAGIRWSNAEDIRNMLRFDHGALLATATYDVHDQDVTNLARNLWKARGEPYSTEREKKQDWQDALEDLREEQQACAVGATVYERTQEVTGLPVMFVKSFCVLPELLNHPNVDVESAMLRHLISVRNRYKAIAMPIHPENERLRAVLMAHGFDPQELVENVYGRTNDLALIMRRPKGRQRSSPN